MVFLRASIAISVAKKKWRVNHALPSHRTQDTTQIQILHFENKNEILGFYVSYGLTIDRRELSKEIKELVNDLKHFRCVDFFKNWNEIIWN